MIMILSVMLTGTFIGAITLKKESRQDTPETEPVSPSEGSAVVPSTFKGSVIDEFGVEKEVMDLIVSYMDAYYKSVFTLEQTDTDPLFDNELMAAVSRKAIALVVDTRKDHRRKILTTMQSYMTGHPLISHLQYTIQKKTSYMSASSIPERLSLLCS